MSIDLSRIISAETKARTALDAARLAAEARLIAAIEAAAAAITGPVPLTEKLSWGSKEIAARAVASGSATPAQAAMIADEASVTGEAPADLAARVIRNADGYRSIIATLTGLRRQTEAALDKAASVEAMDAVLRATLDRLSAIGD